MKYIYFSNSNNHRGNMLSYSIKHSTFTKVLQILITNLCFYKYFIFTLILVTITNVVNSQSAFIKNNGQWDNKILYKSDFNVGKLYIEKGSFNYNFYDTEDLNKYIIEHHKKQLYDDSREIVFHGHCLKTNFINSNKNIEIVEEDKLLEYYNYYLGKDTKKWASKVPAFNTLKLKNLYNNIDLILKISDNAYKYDFIIKPNANIEQIKINYLGSDKISLENGNLIIKTSVNDLIEQKPYAYQIYDGKKIEVDCNYFLEEEIVSFEFPRGYDKSKELIIDPYIVFSRISGSNADNFGYTATYDSEENAYGAGSVFGVGFVTTPGAYDLTFNGSNTDIGIIKYSPDGLIRLFSTYLGGNRTDLPHSIVVNSRDELYVLGTTSSNNFPIDTFLTSFDPTFNGGSNINFTGLGVTYTNGSDIVLARFTADGTNLLSSTYLGGSGNDGLNTSTFLKYNYADEIRGEVLIDKDDNCFVVSSTSSSDFPIGPTGVFQDNIGGGLDAVIIKMDENLTNILWSTFLGGSDDDAAYSLDFDEDENIVLTGGTHSDDFPTLNAYQSVFGGGNSDGFITRLHSSGSGVLSSTYLGSPNYDQIYFVEVNNIDEVHIFGQTRASSGDFVFNAAYNKPNGGQLLSKFNPTIDTLIRSTRFGDESGVPDISPTAFLVDVCNRVFLSGWGWGGVSYISGTTGLETTADAIDNTTDNQDFYFMVLQDDASSLIYGSFFGGDISREHVDGGTSRFDKKGVIYQAICAGCGGNQDFPTIPAGNSWPNNSSNCNLGVVKYAFSPPSIIADFSVPNTDCVPVTLHFENQSQTAFNDTSHSMFIWTVNGQTFTTYHLDFTFNTSGVYNIQLVAYDTLSCNFVDSVSKQLTIIGNGLTYLDDVGVCSGNLAQIGISPILGTNVTYSWTPDYHITSTTIANPYVNTPVDTIYQLIVSNGNCTDTFIQKVIAGQLNIEIFPIDSICLETSDTLHATIIEGALYEWIPQELIIEGQGTPNVIVYAENSNQDIGLTVTNLDGCTDFVGVNLNTIDDLPDLIVTADPDTIESSQGSQLLVESIEANSFVWETNNHFNTLNISNPYAENILETTTFQVIADNGICPKKDSVTVFVVIPECLEGKFFIPNAFSPNGDENNDIFKVRTTLVNIENFYFAVYDRWGNKIFDTTDKTKGWDGTYKGNELSPNVYGWYVEGLCPGGEEFFIKGNVTLLN